MLVRHLTALFLVGTLATQASAAIRIVAASGQAAPNTTGRFSQLYHSGDGPAPPVINSAGRVAFAATLEIGVGVTALDDTGMWSDGGGAMALVGREGFAAPTGPAGALYRRLANPVLNDTGAIAFGGAMREGVAGVTVDDNGGLWSSGGGATALVAREGNQAVGTAAGVEFAGLIDPTFNNSGQSAFRSTLSGAGVTAANDDGVWSQKLGLLGLIARAGNAAPGTPAGLNFASFTAGLPSINDAGNVSFRAIVAGAGVTTANDTGLWVERGGAVALVAREGSPAAGLEAGTNYGSFSEPVLNSAGQTAFVATLVGGVNAKNVALFAETGNASAVVVRKGDAAPNVAAGSVFANFASPLFNASNDFAFQATISGPNVITSNNDGVWIKQDGALKPIALEGAPAPGAGASELFSSFTELALNASGQIAFFGTLTGAGVTAANDGGIWATTATGELRLVAREGSPLAPGQVGDVSGLYFAGGSNNEDGQRSGFNDRGELAFLATLVGGGSRIAVSDVVVQSSADFNGDSLVNGSDFLIWQKNLGMTVGAQKSNGDADGDGDVDAADLASWKGGFGVMAATAASVAAVPEPGAVALALSAVACLLATRRSAHRESCED
ncbi:MAG: hypothetical protein C0485_10120 [Pirellula sp.]|nr:hypothetical protein [Pirellula sp.]